MLYSTRNFEYTDSAKSLVSARPAVCIPGDNLYNLCRSFIEHVARRSTSLTDSSHSSPAGMAGFRLCANPPSDPTAINPDILETEMDLMLQIYEEQQASEGEH